MKVVYQIINSVDCTSDPHPVEYTAEDEMALREAMLSDIVAVCTSDMVQGIRTIRGQIGEVEYESDYYSDWDGGGDRKQASGDMAEKHKVAGLYFYGDPELGRKHLPPGLTGLKAFIQEVYKAGPDVSFELRVGVVWAFAGSASCSDYITIDPDSPSVTDFGSQDWWQEMDEYLPWCQQMADFLEKPFPYGHGSNEIDDGWMQPQEFTALRKRWKEAVK